MAVMISYALASAKIEASGIMQLKFDWGTKAYTDMYVANSCSSGDATIWSKRMNGSKRECFKYETVKKQRQTKKLERRKQKRKRNAFSGPLALLPKLRQSFGARKYAASAKLLPSEMLCVPTPRISAPAAPSSVLLQPLLKTLFAFRTASAPSHSFSLCLKTSSPVSETANTKRILWT